MSSTASPPDPSDDASAAGAASSNFALLYIIIAVLVGVILYMAVRYGRSVLSEWRQLQAFGAGHGASPTRLGLSMDDIAALPTFTFRAPEPSPHGSATGGGRRSGSGKGKSVVECVVCLQELEDGDVVRVLPACRHFFHGSCIDVWLCAHSTCPVCRAHPEPERALIGEVTVSPPLPQLRRCGASPERPAASRVLADILARSPLRSSCSTSASKEIVSKSPSPGPTAREYIMSRSPSPTPPTHGRVNERCSKSPPPRMPEIVVLRSMSPSTRSVGVLEGTEVITSASPYPVTAREDGCGSLSKSPSPVPHYVVAEERQQ